MSVLLTISQTTEKLNKFQTLIKVLHLSGFYETFDRFGKFTMFAPTDQAFGQIPARIMENLPKPENVTALRALVGYHTVRGTLQAKQLADKKSVANIVGSTLRFAFDEDSFRVNNALVIESDIKALNGCVHIIDRVLLPLGKSEKMS